MIVYAGSTLWLHSLLGPIATKQNKKLKLKSKQQQQVKWNKFN